MWEQAGGAVTTACTSTRPAGSRKHPGLRFPRELGRWVPRDGIIAYLERYAERYQLEVLFETSVSWRSTHAESPE